MEYITSDHSQKTTIKGVQWNSLIAVFGFETLVHMWNMLRWAYLLQRFKQWADLKTEQVQMHSLVNPYHGPGWFDATVILPHRRQCECCRPIRLKLGRACTALVEDRSEWTQQSDQSRELKCGNQINTPLPVSWFRTRAVVGDGGDVDWAFHCLPFPCSSKAVTDFTPHCHPANCHSASKPHTGRRASWFFVGCALGIVNEPLMSTSFYILGCISFL